ncbi:MAG: hypothetical protein H6825_03485 [Planctomycetes bacterium]|nr:hypothetical protein [Planctomycetota bacterium]
MKPSSRSLGSLLCVLALTLLPSPARAASDAAADVVQANALLTRAEANLALVDGSIGHLTRPPAGSAAKLAKLRLDQAFGDLEPAGKLLATAGGAAGAAEANARYAAAAALHERLAAILTGKPATPATEPAGSADPPRTSAAEAQPVAPATVKLGYPHADNLKNTLFTMREVEGLTTSLGAWLDALRPVDDPLTIDFRTSAAALDTLAEARRKAGFVRDGLAKIPANGEGVAEAQQRLADAEATLDAAEEFFVPLDAKLRALVDPAAYPQFDADLQRLRELSRMYAGPELTFQSDRAQAVAAFAQADAAEQEGRRILDVYARLVAQQTDQGVRIASACEQLLSQRRDFLAVAEAQKAVLPGEIRAHLAEADRYADEAVAAQKPLWFTGGIPQCMGWADEKLGLYAALDPAGGVTLAHEVDAMRASLRTRADSLRELIIRENPLPPDGYEGDDRDAAVAVAIDAWKHQQPDFELLAVRIPSKAWSRETKWTYSNGSWYFVDRSTLQVRLIVADTENPEYAIDRPVNVRRDHQKGDTLIGVPLRGIEEALEPNEYVLRSRVE